MSPQKYRQDMFKLLPNHKGVRGLEDHRGAQRVPQWSKLNSGIDHKGGVPNPQ